LASNIQYSFDVQYQIFVDIQDPIFRRPNFIFLSHITIHHFSATDPTHPQWSNPETSIETKELDYMIYSKTSNNGEQICVSNETGDYAVKTLKITWSGKLQKHI
jgi:hypothetical protein